MTAQLAALDWRDTLIVVGILLGLTAAERIYEAWLFTRERRLNRMAVADIAHEQPVREPDHEPCTSCGHTICFCPRQGECPGCINLGCLHLTTPDLLCADCRNGCPTCRAEDEVERAIAAVRDDAAVRSFR